MPHESFNCNGGCLSESLLTGLYPGEASEGPAKTIGKLKRETSAPMPIETFRDMAQSGAPWEPGPRRACACDLADTGDCGEVGYCEAH